MLPKLPNEKELAFIQKNLKIDLKKLALSMKKDAEIDQQFVLSQISARQKIEHKLPTWVQNFDLVFPVALSLEQSSSELTASFKASSVKGNKLLDLSLGMGIDFWKMSQSFDFVIGVERNTDLAIISNYNLSKLIDSKVEFEVLNQDSNEFLKQNSQKFDWIFIDPARRDDKAQKAALLEDCEPNILKIKDKLFEFSDQILLKLSPMLDIDLAVQQLQHVQKVWVIAVENEVKELLISLDKNGQENHTISCCNFLKNGDINQFEFSKSEEKSLNTTYSKPLNYLYEPNAAILKAGAFKSIGEAFGLHKLHQHSHLYTSETLITGFPGRIFKINSVENLDRKAILAQIKTGKANITTRNFPLSVAEIRSKLKLADGGHDYLFATTDLNSQKIIILCEKLSN